MMTGKMATKSRRAARKPTNGEKVRKLFALYWCTTNDGGEDWFVVANTARGACRFHEDAEGYERGGAQAERIVQLPDHLLRAGSWQEPKSKKWNTSEWWPSDELLVACGGEIAPLERDDLRTTMGIVCKVVRFGSRLFRPGDIVTSVRRQHRITEPPGMAVFKGGAG